MVSHLLKENSLTYRVVSPNNAVVVLAVVHGLVPIVSTNVGMDYGIGPGVVVEAPDVMQEVHDDDNLIIMHTSIMVRKIPVSLEVEELAAVFVYFTKPFNLVVH